MSRAISPAPLRRSRLHQTREAEVQNCFSSLVSQKNHRTPMVTAIARAAEIRQSEMRVRGWSDIACHVVMVPLGEVLWMRLGYSTKNRFFAPSSAKLTAAPFVVNRGNHSACETTECVYSPGRRMWWRAP